MAIPNELIFHWIDEVSRITGLQMDPDTLVDDIVIMAMVFPTEDAFVLAMDNTVRAINQLITGQVTTSQLAYQYAAWSSYHYQSRRTQGHRADMRIVFQTTAPTRIRVKGFGHRHIPSDIYERLKTRSLPPPTQRN